jgi:hypothetical protein
MKFLTIIKHYYPYGIAIINHYWLVVSTPLKNMKVSWDYDSQYLEKQKMFQTSY